jgi:hypothetical protein
MVLKLWSHCGVCKFVARDLPGKKQMPSFSAAFDGKVNKERLFAS